MKKQKNKLIQEVYSSAKTLPINNWWEIHDSNINYIFKDPREPEEAELEELDVIWDVIVCEYFDMVGINQNYIELLEQKRRIYLLKIERQKSNNTSLDIHISIEEEKLEIMLGSEKSDVSRYEQKASLEKHMGFQINGNTTSVIDYFSYVNLIEKQIIAQRNGSRKTN